MTWRAYQHKTSPDDPHAQLVDRRAARVAAFDGRYEKRYKRGQRANCVYCWLPASVGDHVPALAQAFRHDASAPHVVYPACAVCNQALSAIEPVCLKARAEWLRPRLHKEVMRAVAPTRRRPRPAAWPAVRRIVNAMEGLDYALKSDALRLDCACLACQQWRGESCQAEGFRHV